MPKWKNLILVEIKLIVQERDTIIVIKFSVNFTINNISMNEIMLNIKKEKDASLCEKTYYIVMNLVLYL